MEFPIDFPTRFFFLKSCHIHHVVQRQTENVYKLGFVIFPCFRQTIWLIAIKWQNTMCLVFILLAFLFYSFLRSFYFVHLIAFKINWCRVLPLFRQMGNEMSHIQAWLLILRFWGEARSPNNKKVQIEQKKSSCIISYEYLPLSIINSLKRLLIPFFSFNFLKG